MFGPTAKDVLFERSFYLRRSSRSHRTVLFAHYAKEALFIPQWIFWSRSQKLCKRCPSSIFSLEIHPSSSLLLAEFRFGRPARNYRKSDGSSCLISQLSSTFNCPRVIQSSIVVRWIDGPVSWLSGKSKFTTHPYRAICSTAPISTECSSPSSKLLGKM